MVEHDVTAGEQVRRRMQQDLGRVATPAVVIGKRVFWGFEANRADIADLLGMPPGAASSGSPVEGESR